MKWWLWVFEGVFVTLLYIVSYFARMSAVRQHGGIEPLSSPFSFVNLTRIATMRPDQYIHSDGSILPSVNEILDATAENKSTKPLTPSQVKKREQAFERGRLVHEAIADSLTGSLSGMPEIIHPWQQSIRGFVSEVLRSEATITSSEKPLIHDQLRYGGTHDLILSWSDTSVLVEMKSTQGSWSYDPQTKARSYSPYWPWFRKAAEDETTPRLLSWDWVSPYLKRAWLQSSFYKILADYHQMPISEIWVVVLTKAQFQVLPMPGDLWGECYTEAIARLEQFHHQTQESEVA